VLSMREKGGSWAVDDHLINVGPWIFHWEGHLLDSPYIIKFSSAHTESVAGVEGIDADSRHRGGQTLHGADGNSNSDEQTPSAGLRELQEKKGKEVLVT